MTRHHEYRALMAGIGAMSALAATSAVVSTVEHIVGAAPLATALVRVPTTSSASSVREGTPS